MAVASVEQEGEEIVLVMEKIGRILEEAKASNATHIRKLKDLSAIKSNSTLVFFSAFSKTLTPLFNHHQRRLASAERIVRFVSAFATTPPNLCDPLFLQQFVRFLLGATTAANNTARFRACQLISEVQFFLQFPFTDTLFAISYKAYLLAFHDLTAYVITYFSITILVSVS